MTRPKRGAWASLLTAIAAQFCAIFLIAPVAVATDNPAGKGEVHLYSYRQAHFMRVFLSTFESQTGIKVKVTFADTPDISALRRHAATNTVDVILAPGIVQLQQLVEEDLLQPVRSAVLEENTPAGLRDPRGLWYGLTLRSQLIAVAKDRVPEEAITTYEGLADARWKGRLCLDALSRPGNIGLIAAFTATHGRQRAGALTDAITMNLAGRSSGGELKQVRAVHDGICDVTLINNTTYSRMTNDLRHPEHRAWAESLRLVFPNQQDRGTHVNVTAAGVYRHAANWENAVRLIEFLGGHFAQKIFAMWSYEYPVNPTVPWDRELVKLGEFKMDSLEMSRIASESGAARELAGEAGW